MSNYEQWQWSRYGNILPSSNHEEELENGVSESEEFEEMISREVEVDLMEGQVVEDWDRNNLEQSN